MARNWAIAIGVNQYVNMPPLKYAKRDAELMQDYFLNEADFEKVYLFTDDSPPITDAGNPFSSQPTYGTLKRFLRVRFNQPFMSAGDNLWFLFSGHGLRHADRDYLMPSDADPHPEGVNDTAITMNYVTERLRRCGADNVVLILDACRNEQSSRGLGVGEEKQKGVITISSCSPSERSYEIEQIQQGSFTYVLLESLRIQGENNCATVERLYQRLRYRVTEINRQYNKPRQTPYAIAEPATKYHLILLPRQATLQDIATLKLDAQEAELEGQDRLAEQLWTRILTVSPADPQALKALRRIWSKSKPSPPQPEPVTTPSGVRSSTPVPSPEVTPSQKPKPEPDKVFKFDVITVNAEGRQVKREKGEAQYFTEDLGNGITLDMVSVPGGKFLMGTSDEEIERLCKKYHNEYFRCEKPQHEVTVQPFFMGKFQVTQTQWRAIAALPKVKHDLEPDPSYFKGDDLPVEQVSWYDAVEFCERLSKMTGRDYRLPSEAEWEYACRAGTTTPFHFGETITTDLANYDARETYAGGPFGEYRKKPTSVGSFPPNAFGLYDMHGNVFEWCADTWHHNYQSAPTDGSACPGGENDNRSSVRGGSCYHKPQYCRSAFRSYYSRRVDRDDRNGFRVVCGSGRTLELLSEKGVDYTPLRDLLAAGKWKDADQETADRMLQAMSKNSWGEVEKEDLLNLPCADLRTINSLWLKSSNGKFGFSVQKDIWIEVGGTPGNYDSDIYYKFSDRIGWRKEGEWLNYSELTFNTNAPRGHLPTSGRVPLGWYLFSGGGFLGGWYLFGGTSSLAQRIVTCKL